ncbi:beta-N-acetylhexosaminidase [Pseudarthrobacter sp. N5]|uniref:beta-N-acetylhexosaminidase n=1 Tax=Pseudarthrobacter sp. N5 TaxID=3418416 RepID=UPI003CF6A35A
MPQSHHLIPQPCRVLRNDAGAFALTGTARIVAAEGCRIPAEELALVLRRSTGFDLPILDGQGAGMPRPGDISLVLDNGVSGAEGYTLTSGPGRVQIAAATSGGLFNGVQTLRQLFPAAVESLSPVDASWIIPAVAITDEPRLPYRGLMLDVARSFLGVAEIKRQIDTMSQFKMNALHLHLTDDQAWRIEIHEPAVNPSGLDYGNLTRLGGTGAVDAPGVGLTPGVSGFYTQRDFQDLAEYAARKNVLLVPEIDLPGHVNAALAAIAQLNPDGLPQKMNTTGEVGYSTLDPDNPVTYEFVREVLGQIAAITPGPYLHLGGDEALVTSHGSYVRMVSDFSRMVQDTGKTPVGWNEYAAADIPEGSVVQYWHGPLEPTQARARDAGSKVLMSPASTTYLDQKYGPDSPIGLSWMEGGPFTWAEYYGWDPAGQGIPEDHLLGVEGPLWTETVRGGMQADWLIYPRAISLAEVGWTPQELRDKDGFARRLGGAGARLALQGVAFHPSPGIEWKSTPPPAFPAD